MGKSNNNKKRNIKNNKININRKSPSVLTKIIYLTGILLIVLCLIFIRSNSRREKNIHNKKDNTINNGRNKGRNNESLSVNKKELNYDDYIKLGQNNNWTTVDPVDRLVIDLKSYCNIAISNRYIDQSTNQLEKTLKSDISLLITLLKRSTDRNFNLSIIAFDVLENTQQCFYQLAKTLLPNHPHRLVTKKMLDQVAYTWIYYPIQELLRLKVGDLNNDTIKSFDHILLELDLPLGRGGRNLLSLVTMYKMYRLLPVLLGLDVSPDGALVEAISNQDEYALAILLQHPNIKNHLSDHRIIEYANVVSNPRINELLVKGFNYWNITIDSYTFRSINISIGFNTYLSNYLSNPSNDLNNSTTSYQCNDNSCNQLVDDIEIIISDDSTNQLCNYITLYLSNLSTSELNKYINIFGIPVVIVDDINALDDLLGGLTNNNYISNCLPLLEFYFYLG